MPHLSTRVDDLLVPAETLVASRAGAVDQGHLTSTKTTVVTATHTHVRKHIYAHTHIHNQPSIRFIDSHVQSRRSLISHPGRTYRTVHATHRHGKRCNRCSSQWTDLSNIAPSPPPCLSCFHAYIYIWKNQLHVIDVIE